MKMKFSSLILTIVLYQFAFVSVAQTDSIQAQKRMDKPKSGDELYVGLSNVYGFRTMKQRDNLFGQALGIKADEIPMWTMSYDLGYRIKMQERFSLEFGIEFNQIGFQYRTLQDSSFVGYDFKIQGFTTPLRGNLQWGKDLIFNLGAGIAPRMLMNSRFTTIEKDSFGKEQRNTLSKTDGFTSFNLDLLINAGLRWNFAEHIGLYFIPEFRYGLFDVYQKQSPQVVHTYGLFLRWGLQWQL